MDAKNINLELDSKILESENPLLKRCKMFLEDNDFIKANEYAERVLDEEPECALAYLFLLMAEIKVSDLSSLLNSDKDFSSSPHYVKIMRFGDEKVKDTLSKILDAQKSRKEQSANEKQYQAATKKLFSCKNLTDYDSALKKLKTLHGYRDVDEIIEKYESQRDAFAEKIYSLAKRKLESGMPYAARNGYYAITGLGEYKDSLQLIEKYRETVLKHKFISVKSCVGDWMNENEVYVTHDRIYWTSKFGTKSISIRNYKGYTVKNDSYFDSNNRLVTYIKSSELQSSNPSENITAGGFDPAKIEDVIKKLRSNYEEPDWENAKQNVNKNKIPANTNTQGTAKKERKGGFLRFSASVIISLVLSFVLRYLSENEVINISFMDLSKISSCLILTAVFAIIINLAALIIRRARRI